MGIIFGIVATYLIKRIFNDQISVVNITVISCYLLFFVAENINLFNLKVSGIISLVSLGLYMAAFGKTRIASEAHFAVEGFWKYAVFLAETVIFILAGILVGIRVFGVVSFINVSDYYKLFVLYICMMLSRFLSISIFMRILPHIGYGLTWK